MKILAPDYYTEFRCIASLCRHNCCIGWEIDIDGETLNKYDALSGVFGKRLRESIERDEAGAHFRLCDGDRCPFLNEAGLCDIITFLGEEALSEICTLHPRYRHFLSDHCEIGLGLSCEEAVRLLLSKADKTRLVPIGDDGEEPACPDTFEKELLKTRDSLIAHAQNRDLPLKERMRAVLAAVGAKPSPRPLSSWAAYYRGLERLDGAWDACLDALVSPAPDGYAEAEGEQLLVYFLLRHATAVFDGEELSARAAFAVHATEMIRAVSYALPSLGLAEAVRLYSSEIEYSEENTEAIVEKLWNEM